MGGDLSPIFHIAGIAAATMIIEYVMQRFGHGDKVVFVNILGYGIVAVYSLRTWFGFLGNVASMFGIII